MKRHNYKLISITPTLEASPNYVSGDVLFVSTEIPDFFQEENSAAQIVSVSCFDKAAISPQFILYFTANATDFGTINATASIADADAQDIQATIPIVTGDWYAGASYTDNAGFAHITNTTVDGIGSVVSGYNYNRTTFSTSLYITAIATATIDAASTSDLTIKIGVKY